MKKNINALIVVTIVLIIAAIAALIHGQYEIGLKDIWKIILLKFSGSSNEELSTPSLVLWSVRLPRVIMAILAGSALSVAGAVFQGIMRNPLVSPSILGVSSGASFGAAMAIFLSARTAFTVELSALFWGLIAVMIAYKIGNRGINSITTLVLAGVIVSAIFSAGLSFMMYQADPYEQLPAIVFWTMGGFNKILWANVFRAFIIISIGIIVIYIFRWRLNLLATGDEEAMSMGVNIKTARALYVTFATVIVAAATASCGTIGWVGLVVPHMSRMIVGPDHEILIPFSALLGGTFMLLMDTIVRNLPGGEIPISIITSFLGAPFLAYLLMRQNRQDWKL